MESSYEAYESADLNLMRRQRFGNCLLKGLRKLADEKGLPYVAERLRFSCHSVNGGRMNFPVRDLSPGEKPEALRRVLESYVAEGSRDYNGDNTVEMGFCEPGKKDNKESYDIVFNQELADEAWKNGRDSYRR